MIPYTARNYLLSGIPGTFSHEGPKRAIAALIASTAVAANCRFSHAFTFASENDENSDEVVPGGSGVFAGIMVHPHAYAVDRDNVLPGTVSEFAQMGYLTVAISGENFPRGAKVGYLPSTGALVIVGADGAEAAIEIPGATVSRHPHSREKDSEGRVLAVVTLNGELPTAFGSADAVEPGTGD